MRLQFIDLAVLFTYLLFVLGIGFWLKDRIKTSADFLTAGHSLPAWVTGLAFMAANLGSLEIVGMVAMGAKYGMMTNHWYWVGAIPPMIFLGLFMMRFYYSNRIRSVPEYLRLRFDGRSHVLNSTSFLVVTILMSGINMYALALFCGQLLGWPFHFSVAVCALVVVLYTYLGGLRSSIYNEVLQFCLIVAGFVPLTIVGLIDVGGWKGLTGSLPASYAHTWTVLGSGSNNPLGVEWYVAVIALMMIMGPSYWCTDFLLVQRALAAQSLNDARRTPLIAAIPKMLFPALVTVPGMIAAVVIPSKIAGNYNLALPLLMERYYPNGLLGLGFTALLASFMSGMAGNVTAFNTIWTYDIYQTYLVKQKPDRHYLTVGRLTTVVGTLLSVAAAYIVLSFDNLMDYMQLIGTIFISPFFVVFLLGMFSRRITPSGGFWGMVAGVSGCFIQYGLYRTGVVHYPTSMAATLHLAIWGGVAGLVTCILVSFFTKAKPLSQLEGLVFVAGSAASYAPKMEKTFNWYASPAALAVLVVFLFCALNIAFR